MLGLNIHYYNLQNKKSCYFIIVHCLFVLILAIKTLTPPLLLE